MNKSLKVLIVEDSPDDAELLLRELRGGGFDVTFEQVDSSAAMKAALARQPWDLILSDNSMPRFTGSEALKLAQESGHDIPFIVVSGAISEVAAVMMMKLGAHDYLMKDTLARLLPAVERELHEAEVRRDRTRANDMAVHLAYYDPITHLPNRTLFYDQLEQAILVGHRAQKPLALFLIDLDRFKEINDTLGHHNGDLLLHQVGQRLREVLRESDTVARLGGDEFAVLLPEAGEPDQAVLVIQKILNALEQPFILEGLTIHVGASIGVTLCPEHGEDVNLLVQRADIAMYWAKQSGGAGYAMYTPDQDSYSPAHLVLMGELRHAIDRGQLFLAYQLKVDLKTRRVCGVEALVRWQHPQQGVIPPDQFILLAERTGLIKPLTLWVINEALRQCQLWQQAGMEITVAVNLSARNLQDPQLPDQVASLLATWGVVPGQLELEITESILMADPARAKEILTRLNKLGVRFSIDDFGTGYSSLGYLKKLPVDEIKIDRSFVMKMSVDNDDAVIVRSTIDLAHNLDLRVVAEGVENKETYDRLVALGCDAAQGYYLNHPIPAAEMTRWLRESPWGLRPKEH